MSKRTRVWGAVAAFALATSAIVWGVPGLSGAASQHANAPQQKQDASSAPVGGGTTGRATFQNLATAPERPANRGPVDNDENDEEEYLARAAHGTSTAASLPPSQRHATPAGNTPPALRGINFAATNQNQSGSFPPDNDLAVGRNHVVQVTNFAVSIFNKSGGFVKRTSFATFFNTSDFVFNKDLPVPYVLEWNLAVQRELPSHMTIEARYIGRTVQTSDMEIIEVKFQEIDGMEKVLMVERVAGEAA